MAGMGGYGGGDCVCGVAGERECRVERVAGIGKIDHHTEIAGALSPAPDCRPDCRSAGAAGDAGIGEESGAAAREGVLSEEPVKPRIRGEQHADAAAAESVGAVVVSGAGGADPGWRVQTGCTRECDGGESSAAGGSRG